MLLHPVAEAQNTPVFSSFLGKGYNIANKDMWTMGQSMAFDVFQLNLPDSCFQILDCSHVSTSETGSYSSTEEWSRQVSTDLGIDGKGMYEMVTASVSASYGSTTSYEHGSSRQSFYAKSYNRQACYQMRPSCIFNTSYVTPELFEVASKLPVGVSDPASLDQWEQQFLQRFGSHVTIYSEHGAQVRSLTSIDTQTLTSKDCLELKACATLGYLTNTAKVCPSKNTCTLHDNVDKAVTHSCVVAGGDSKSAATAAICSGNSSAWEAFMGSGDIKSGSSAYSYKYKSIAELLNTNGYAQQAAALELAVRRQGCVQPQYTYMQTATGAYDCVCTLTCQHGGTVDPTTCTCNCPGTSLQGYRGTFCAEEYGMCQHGAGSATIGPHCDTSPFCGATECSPASTCCKAPVLNNGACCPYMSKCSITPFTASCAAVELADSVNASILV